jgi:hypothetical protein
MVKVGAGFASKLFVFRNNRAEVIGSVVDTRQVCG